MGLLKQRPGLVVAANTYTSEPVGVGADAAIVRVVARMVLAGRRADRLAVVRVAALGTAHQALQQVFRSAQTEPGTTPVLLELLVNGSEYGGIHDRRHWDVQPVLKGRVPMAGRITRLEGPPTLSPQTWPQWPSLRLSKRSHPHVGRVIYHVTSGRTVPEGFPYATL